jgi:hypothetical protein
MVEVDVDLMLNAFTLKPNEARLQLAAQDNGGFTWEFISLLPRQGACCLGDILPHFSTQLSSFLEQRQMRS